MKGRCVWCGAKERLVRVDLYPPPPHGCIDSRASERGLGKTQCTNPKCEGIKYDKDDPEGREFARMSPGRTFYEFLKNNMRCGGRKWTNRCQQHADAALRLAIAANLEFFPWDAEFVPFGESEYALACMPSRGDTPNRDVAKAVEAQYDRPAFMLEGKRVALGAKFWWRAAGGTVKVTSIRALKVGNHDKYLVCVCERVGGHSQYKITAAELRAADKAGDATWERWHPERAVAARRAKHEGDATT